MTKEQFEKYQFSKNTQVLYKNGIGDKVWENVTGVDFERETIDAGGYVIEIQVIEDIQQNE